MLKCLHKQLLQTLNYYFFFLLFLYFKMKKFVQINQGEKLLLLGILVLLSAFLSNLIPLHLFKSLTCKQRFRASKHQ